MKKAQTFLLPALAALGLLAGGLTGYFKKTVKETNKPAEALSQQEKLQTDAFSLKLFQQVLLEQKGNIMVTPHTVSEALLALQGIAAGKTQEDLAALQLTQAKASRQPEPFRNVLLTVDINVPRTDEKHAVLPLRYSEDLPQALSFFNSVLAQGGPDSNAQFATSDMVSTRTRLLIGAAIYCNLSNHLPFHAEHSRMDDFDSATGAMPRYHQMRSRGLYRTAGAEDASWQAVAIPLHQQSKTPLALICIRPASSARQFAESLTPELLTRIRQALASATPKDTLVELPRIVLQVPPYDMRHTLRRLGLASLFDSDTADFSRLSPDKIHLNAMVHASGITIAENRKNTTTPASELEQAENSISFSRPFIWIVADLSTNTPLEYIGLVEEM